MKGDFSKWNFERRKNDRGVLHQQGRVLLDSDWNAQTWATMDWEDQAGRDIVGPRIAAIPSSEAGSFKIHNAGVTPQGKVKLDVSPGRAWIDGLLVHLTEDQVQNMGMNYPQATYLEPRFQNGTMDVHDIGEGVRDAVVLEVWKEALNAFQDPEGLLEPALGGPDTTERIHTAMRFRLLRLDQDDQCPNFGSRLEDDLDQRGKLTVSLLPVQEIEGDCPVTRSGGYTGFEHHLYRIEIARVHEHVLARFGPMFKWSQFNGGLVGRGDCHLVEREKRITITANDQLIKMSGLDDFYLEIVEFDADLGYWRVTYGASVALNRDDLDIIGDQVYYSESSIPSGNVFFRLWNGIRSISDFPRQQGPAASNELRDGILLQFEPDNSNNYVPADFWTFPLRAGDVSQIGEEITPGRKAIEERPMGPLPEDLMKGKMDAVAEKAVEAEKEKRGLHMPKLLKRDKTETTKGTDTKESYKPEPREMEKQAETQYKKMATGSGKPGPEGETTAPPKLIFTLVREYRRYLGDGKRVNRKIRKAFEEHDVLLSRDSKTTMVKQDHWEIMESTKRYRLMITDTHIDVFNKDLKIPTRSPFVKKNGFVNMGSGMILLDQAPPEGIRYHRASLAILNWNSDHEVSFEDEEIQDCRDVFHPLTRQNICCTFTVGDGSSSFGDFDSIHEAVRHLPRAGGELCLLPGMHETNVIIQGRSNITIKGCGSRTRVIPDRQSPDDPVISIIDCQNITICGLEIDSVGGSGIVVLGSEPGAVKGIHIQNNRIMALEHAVRIVHGEDIYVQNNRIRMWDRQGGDVAVHVHAEDSIIENNEIEVIPGGVDLDLVVSKMPMVLHSANLSTLKTTHRIAQPNILRNENPGLQGSGNTGSQVTKTSTAGIRTTSLMSLNSSDRNVRSSALYQNTREFSRSAELLWAAPIRQFAQLKPSSPYLAKGGIQIASGSERVRISHNHISGGAGNGITLGSDPQWTDLVETIGNEPKAQEIPKIYSEGKNVMWMVRSPTGEPLNGVAFSVEKDGKAHEKMSSEDGYLFKHSGGAQYRMPVISPNMRIQNIERGVTTDSPRFATADVVNRITLEQVADDDLSETMDWLDFIYDVTIEENEISGMGLSGIGIPRVQESDTSHVNTLRGMTTTRPQLFLSLNMASKYGVTGGFVVNLSIDNNHIYECLQNVVTKGTDGEIIGQGVGGISLGFCENLIVRENKIEDNGGDKGNPVCGVFAIYANQSEVSNNQLLDNGLIPDTSVSLRRGIWGGIVLLLSSALWKATDKALYQNINTRGGHAARIHDNAVDQPVGRALTLNAFGPVSIANNMFNSELTAPGVVNSLVGGVLVTNIGGGLNKIRDTLTSFYEDLHAEDQAPPAERPTLSMPPLQRIDPGLLVQQRPIPQQQFTPSPITHMPYGMGSPAGGASKGTMGIVHPQSRTQMMVQGGGMTSTKGSGGGSSTERPLSMSGGLVQGTGQTPMYADSPGRSGNPGTKGRPGPYMVIGGRRSKGKVSTGEASTGKGTPSRDGLIPGDDGRDEDSSGSGISKGSGGTSDSGKGSGGTTGMGTHRESMVISSSSDRDHGATGSTGGKGGTTSLPDIRTAATHAPDKGGGVGGPAREVSMVQPMLSMGGTPQLQQPTLTLDRPTLSAMPLPVFELPAQPVQPVLTELERVHTDIPNGNILFVDNQIRLGPRNGSLVSQIIMTSDDLGYDGNQSDIMNSRYSINTFLAGNTIRACTSRFKEPVMWNEGTARLSLLSISKLLNSTNLNQANHCILALSIMESRHPNLGYLNREQNLVLLPAKSDCPTLTAECDEDIRKLFPTIIDLIGALRT